MLLTITRAKESVVLVITSSILLLRIVNWDILKRFLIFAVVENEKPNEKVNRLYHRSIYLSRLLMIPAASALIELIEQILDLPDEGLASEIAG